MRPIEPEQEDARHLLGVRDLTYGGLLGALALALPVVFHLLGAAAGPVLLPMYLPLLALGLLANWRVSLPVACGAPLVSALLTGMPPLAPPVAVLMALELSVLALTAGLCRGGGLGVWPAALAAVVCSRLCGAAVLWVVGPVFGLPAGSLLAVLLGLAAAWPGTALQLTVVPGLVLLIERQSLMGSRFTRS